MSPAEERAPARDPRDIITPEAFRVLPALYGLPLADPWRRLAAVTIDAVLVVVLAQSGGLLLGVAAAVLFYSWMSGRATAGSGGLRKLVAIAGSIMLFMAVVAIVEPLLHDDDPPNAAQGTLQGRDALLAGIGAARLYACDDAACRATELDRLGAAIAKSDLPPAERAELLRDLAEGADASDEELARLERRYAEAATPPQPAPAATPSGDDGEAEARSLVGADGSFSLLRTLRALAEDLGFSFGWGAVYFTLLTVLWEGQTLGKRWLGIRVIALSGRPLGYWEAFNRYGGYAAGFATGLLGFLQVFWDANRQAIHDRIAFTAVIRDARGEALARVRAAAPDAASEVQPQA